MELEEILAKVDHTILSPTTTLKDIRSVCEDGIKFKTASVCIPACYVKDAKEFVGNKLKICTVIGFPNGYSTTAVKVFETKDAVNNGADEIDMVINIGWLKDKKFDLILDEINKVKGACSGKLLKVIIETCLLTDDEKIKMCEIVSDSKADFIKTSTGFSKSGATFDDIVLIKEHVRRGLGIKAAGGIKSIESANVFLSLGATRLGTSKVVSLAKEMYKI